MTSSFSPRPVRLDTPFTVLQRMVSGSPALKVHFPLVNTMGLNDLPAMRTCTAHLISASPAGRVITDHSPLCYEIQPDERHIELLEIGYCRPKSGRAVVTFLASGSAHLHKPMVPLAEPNISLRGRHTRGNCRTCRQPIASEAT